MKQKIRSIIFYTFFLSLSAIAQDGTIYLKNPSFEGVPKPGGIHYFNLEGWSSCGFKMESKPDIHPIPNSPYGVTSPPAEQDTYLGMVVRDNETWEQIGQELGTPMQAGQPYYFSIQLSKSADFESASRNSGMKKFTTPCLLRVWGGFEDCERKELLATGPLVINTKWRTYKFILEPEMAFTHLVFEAFYRIPVAFPYNGNLLLDDASPLVPADTTESDWREQWLEGVAVDAATVKSKKQSSLKRFEFEEPHMGTSFKLVFYADSTKRVTEIAKAAFNRIAELEQVMSDYQEDSELNQVIKASGRNKRIDISDDLWSVLQLAESITDKSKGCFDYTAGALTRLWRRAFRQKVLPTDAAIAKALKTVGQKKVLLHSDKQVEIWQEGTRIDLGGIGKGYAVDEALKVLKGKGVTQALVDGGGDIAVGDPPPGKPHWKIKRMIYQEDGSIGTAPITLVNQAIASSGPVENFLTIEGQQYSHIIDPRNGQALTKKEIVSVVGPSCAEADAWATALSVTVIMSTYKQLKKAGFQVYFTQ